MAGAQFTCFTSTKAQILTPEDQEWEEKEEGDGGHMESAVCIQNDQFPFKIIDGTACGSTTRSLFECEFSPLVENVFEGGAWGNII